MQIMQICIPRATVKMKTNIPWMNQAIRKAIQKRDSLFCVAKHSLEESDWAKYRRQRNYVVSLLRKSKEAFFQQLNTTDTNTFWKTVRILNHQKSLIPALKVNNTTVDTSVDKYKNNQN